MSSSSSFVLSRIVNGCTSAIESAALDVALNFGVSTGGYMLPVALRALTDVSKFGLVDIKLPWRALSASLTLPQARDEVLMTNIMASDATLIFYLKPCAEMDKAIRYCQTRHLAETSADASEKRTRLPPFRPCLVVRSLIDDDDNTIVRFLAEHKVASLHVTGSASLSTSEASDALCLLVAALQRVPTSTNQPSLGTAYVVTRQGEQWLRRYDGNNEDSPLEQLLILCEGPASIDDVRNAARDSVVWLRQSHPEWFDDDGQPLAGTANSHATLAANTDELFAKALSLNLLVSAPGASINEASFMATRVGKLVARELAVLGPPTMDVSEELCSLIAVVVEVAEPLSLVELTQRLAKLIRMRAVAMRIDDEESRDRHAEYHAKLVKLAADGVLESCVREAERMGWLGRTMLHRRPPALQHISITVEGGYPNDALKTLLLHVSTFERFHAGMLLHWPPASTPDEVMRLAETSTARNCDYCHVPIPTKQVNFTWWCDLCSVQRMIVFDRCAACTQWWKKTGGGGGGSLASLNVCWNHGIDSIAKRRGPEAANTLQQMRILSPIAIDVSRPATDDARYAHDQHHAIHHYLEMNAHRRRRASSLTALSGQGIALKSRKEALRYIFEVFVRC